MKFCPFLCIFSRETLEGLNPDTAAMMKVHNTGYVMGVILTLKGDGKKNGAVDEEGREYDFMSRYFAPWNGIPEDPFTGIKDNSCDFFISTLEQLFVLNTYCTSHKCDPSRQKGHVVGKHCFEI